MASANESIRRTLSNHIVTAQRFGISEKTFLENIEALRALTGFDSSLSVTQYVSQALVDAGMKST